MIPQPPLTLEEHKWYSLKSVPYKAGELQLLPASKFNGHSSRNTRLIELISAFSSSSSNCYSGERS